MLIEGKILLSSTPAHRPGTEFIKHSFQMGFFAEAYSNPSKSDKQSGQQTIRLLPSFYLCFVILLPVPSLGQQREGAPPRKRSASACCDLDAGGSPPASSAAGLAQGGHTANPQHSACRRTPKSTFIPVCPDSHVIISQWHSEANLWTQHSCCKQDPECDAWLPAPQHTLSWGSTQHSSSCSAGC